MTGRQAIAPEVWQALDERLARLPATPPPKYAQYRTIGDEVGLEWRTVKRRWLKRRQAEIVAAKGTEAPSSTDPPKPSMPAKTPTRIRENIHPAVRKRPKPTKTKQQASPGDPPAAESVPAVGELDLTFGG